MFKQEFVKLISKRTKLTLEESNKALDAVMDILKEKTSEGDKYNHPGFGEFYLYTTPSTRKGRNRITGEMVPCRPVQTIKFKMSKTLKYNLNAHLYKDYRK